MVKIEDIKEELDKVRRNINNSIIHDLEDAWHGNSADMYIEKVENLTQEFKKLNNLFDRLYYCLDRYSTIQRENDKNY